MQEVQTFIRLVERPTCTRMRWMFGFQRRLVRRWEWLTFIPNEGRLSQISQTEAIGCSRVVSDGSWGRTGWHFETVGTTLHRAHTVRTMPSDRVPFRGSTGQPKMLDARAR